MLATRSVAPWKAYDRRRARSVSARSAKSVLVVPGYLLDAQEFAPLVEALRKRGFNAALPPIRWYNWLPTVGGRSLRPILDRIDFAARELASGIDVCEDTAYELQPPTPATLLDFLRELQNASNGAQPPLSSSNERPVEDRIALVGCSAAGWICRIFLGSGPPYGGRVYHGSNVVHTLVTLGSPHICNEGITRRNVAFVNTHYPGAFEATVRYLCVAGRAVQGRTYLGGLIKDFTYQSYELCSQNGLDWGDGVTPVNCAVALEGAEKLVLDDVWHAPGDGHRWYGSEDVLEQWTPFLHEQTKLS